MRHIPSTSLGQSCRTYSLSTRVTRSLYRLSASVCTVFDFKACESNANKIQRTFIERRVRPDGGVCSRDPMCIDNGPIPLMKGVRRGLIDDDTPENVRTRETSRGKKQKLVVSKNFQSHNIE